ncbi:hypothetical protein [uncultured Algibacter sp.]|uniref:hypothetical protein n=1 Tax=uncultured Algibacter sp. TaxID=298659 RepID=UPI0032175E15
MSIFGYQSDQINTTVNTTSALGEHSAIKFRPEDVVNTIVFNSNRDSFTLTNTNILMGNDIVFKRTAGVGRFNSERIFRLPVKAFFRGFSRAAFGITFSNIGNPFTYRIDSNGHVFLNGEITSVNEEVIFNFTPYVVETPIRFVDF